MNKISVEEFLTYIEDNDFFERYGDPVMIMLDGKPDMVCMSMEFHIKLVKELDVTESEAHDHQDVAITHNSNSHDSNMSLLKDEKE